MQLLGGVFGMLFAYAINPGNPASIGKGPNVTVGSAFLAEFLYTFALVYVILNVATTEDQVSTTVPSWTDLTDLLPSKDDAPKPLVTLYRDTNGWCPFCERVWLALEIKKIPYQEQLINLQDKPAWFLQMV